MITRRELTSLLGGAAAAWPVALRAQKAPIRIGFLASGAAGSLVSASTIDAIKQGLSDNGLFEGRDYVLEARFAAGNYERFPVFARELAQAGARAILANTIASVRAAQNVTPPVPVIMLSINDPVGEGLVASLARPGGYTTGLGNLNEDLTPWSSDAQLFDVRTPIRPNVSANHARTWCRPSGDIRIAPEFHPTANQHSWLRCDGSGQNCSR